MMIRGLIFSLGIVASSVAGAQHADIRFSYDADVIVLRDGISGYTDGFQIFEGTFPISGFSERFTENPGFLAEDGDIVLPGDSIEMEVLESETFGTFLTYYNPISDEMSTTDATITIEDNGGTDTQDLEIGNLELTGENPQFIKTADAAGEIHAHIDFFLSEEAEFGAFGILFRLTSTNNMVEASQPIWLVFNYGMSPFEFEQLAIPAFVGENLLGDVNGDGQVDLLDVTPFVDLLTSGQFLPAADINGDGAVDLLDVGPFVDLLAAG